MIDWIDAESSDHWQSVDEVDTEHALITTIGFLLKETPEFVVLVMNHDPKNKSCSMTMQIPTPYIVSRKVLKQL